MIMRLFSFKLYDYMFFCFSPSVVLTSERTFAAGLRTDFSNFLPSLLNGGEIAFGRNNLKYFALHYPTGDKSMIWADFFEEIFLTLPNGNVTSGLADILRNIFLTLTNGGQLGLWATFSEKYFFHFPLEIRKTFWRRKIKNPPSRNDPEEMDVDIL